MTNNNFQKVVKSFITPMSQLFTKTLNEAQIQAFVEDLGQFSNAELLGACVVIRRKSKYFPTINEAISACLTVREQERKALPDTTPAKNFVKELNENRVKSIEEYLEKFKTSSMWAGAVKGKWDLALWRYVYAVADVQAQMIQNLRHIGWDSMVIFGAGIMVEDDMRKQFFADQRRQASVGFIDIAIPTNRIHEWEAEVPKLIEQQVA